MSDMGGTNHGPIRAFVDENGIYCERTSDPVHLGLFYSTERLRWVWFVNDLRSDHANNLSGGVDCRDGMEKALYQARQAGARLTADAGYPVPTVWAYAAPEDGQLVKIQSHHNIYYDRADNFHQEYYEYSGQALFCISYNEKDSRWTLYRTAEDLTLSDYDEQHMPEYHEELVSGFNSNDPTIAKSLLEARRAAAELSHQEGIEDLPRIWKFTA